jgi:hypothetical protein
VSLSREEIRKATHDMAVAVKNASNQSGGTIDSGEINGTVLGCGTNGMSMYPNGYGYTSSSKKTTRTTTIVREFNDEGNLVKETETVVEEETNPSYTSPAYPTIYNQ